MSFASPRGRTSDRISLRELNEVYGCPTRRDAMKLALDQSNCLSSASSRLVDLLFDYFKEQTGVNSTTQLVRTLSFDETCNLNSNVRKMGLSLPASAIGWLACHLLPDKSDIQYHKQWEDVQVEYCLPHASPTPQVQSKLSLLKVLLQSHVTHLRVTNTVWPGGSLQMQQASNKGENLPRQNYFESSRRRGRMLLNFDADSVSSFLRFYQRLQQRPRIDMRLFPQVQYVSFHSIPADWIQNLHFASDTLERLSLQRCHLRNISELLLGCKSNDSEATATAVILKTSVHDTTAQETTDVVADGTCEDSLCDGSYDMFRSDMGEDMLQECKYTSLRHVVLSYCGICDSCLLVPDNTVGKRIHEETFTTFGESIFDVLPELITIDLSHNELVNVKDILRGMNKCPCLTVVDMSDNRIRSLEGSHMFIGNLKVLLLSNNYIDNVNGLDRLYSLERLSLDNNQLVNLSDISTLAKLPNLEQLSLLGNPMVTQGKKKYRIHVLNLFKESRLQGNGTNVTFRDILELLPTLDGMRATKKELKLLKYLSFGQRIPKGDTTIRLQRRDILHDTEDQFFRKETVDRIDFTPKPTNPSHVTRNATRLVAVIRSINNESRESRKHQERTRPTTAFAPIEHVIQSIDMMFGTIQRSDSLQQCDSHSYDRIVSFPSVDNDEDSHESVDICLTSTIQSPDGDVTGDFTVPPKISSSLLPDATDGTNIATSHLKDMTNNDGTKKSEDDESIKHFHNHVSKIRHDSPLDFNTSSFMIGDCAQSNPLTTKDVGQKESVWSPSTSEGPPHSSEIELKTNRSVEAKLTQIDFAAMERNDVYDGPDTYSNLCISEYYELYFRCFVFPTTQMNDSVDICEEITELSAIPKIQLYQTDRELMMAFSMKKETNCISPLLHNNNTEYLISVTKENIISCGMAATARIQPKTKEIKNAKGSILYANNVPYAISECQKLLLCISNKAIYFIPDFLDTATNHRPFPSPIGLKSTFSSGYWPHAYCRHPLKYLRKLSFDGYGFQRLTLFFKLPSIRYAIYAPNEIGDVNTYDYTYVICTYSQRETIRLLQTLQQAVKDARPDTKSETMSSSLAIENENISTVKAIGRTLARANFSDDILHYQILYQTWNNCHEQPTDRRSFVLTNNEVFLFNETYGGDLSSCADDEKFPYACYGDIRLRTIASAYIENIVNVCISKDDAMLVIITFDSKSKIRWSSSSWYLKCISLENAELLINDIRNATSC